MTRPDVSKLRNTFDLTKLESDMDLELFEETLKDPPFRLTINGMLLSDAFAKMKPLAEDDAEAAYKMHPAYPMPFDAAAQHIFTIDSATYHIRHKMLLAAIKVNSLWLVSSSRQSDSHVAWIKVESDKVLRPITWTVAHNYTGRPDSKPFLQLKNLFII